LFFYHLERHAVGCHKIERLGAAQLLKFNCNFLIITSNIGLFFEHIQRLLKSLLELDLFLGQHVGDFRFPCLEDRIRIAVLFDHARRNSRSELRADTDFMTVGDRSANESTQDVSLIYVRWSDAIRDDENCGFQVISDYANGSVEIHCEVIGRVGGK